VLLKLQKTPPTSTFDESAVEARLNRLRTIANKLESSRWDVSPRRRDHSEGPGGPEALDGQYTDRRVEINETDFPLEVCPCISTKFMLLETGSPSIARTMSMGERHSIHSVLLALHAYLHSLRKQMRGSSKLHGLRCKEFEFDSCNPSSYLAHCSRMRDARVSGSRSWRRRRAGWAAPAAHAAWAAGGSSEDLLMGGSWFL
jgi:hypothetical protein